MPTTANTAATPPLSSFLAGIAGGSASTIMLYPLDLIKVRMQVDEGPARRRVDVVVGDSIAAAVNNVGVGGSSGGKKSTICTTVRSVIRHEGYVGLYRGLMPAIIGSAASWGGFFIIYEDIKGRMMHRKRTMEQRQHHSSTIGVGEERRFDDNYMSVRLGPIEHFSSSCLAGACMVALTNPLWLIKTRLQLQNSRLLERQMMQQTQPHVGIVTMATNDASTTPSTTEQRRPRVKPPYRGLFHAAYTIAHEEGIMAFYKGSVPALMLVSHGGIQFMTYEFMKGHFSSYVGNGKRNDVERRSKGGTADGIQGKGTIRERLRDSLGYLVMGAMSKL
jgi:solute carrier family 25 folate transporter 32